MSDVDMKKVVEMVGGEPVVKFIKGDVAGHEFHGNQHSAGGAARQAAVAASKQGEAPVDIHLAARAAANKEYQTAKDEKKKASAAKDYYRAKDLAEASAANTDYASRGARD